MSWLCCPTRAFLSFFSSCKLSDLNSRHCSSFSRREPTTSELHLLLCFYPQYHFHLAPYVFFFVTPNLPIAFFSFLELSFFLIYSLFWVSALVLRLPSSNLFVMSSRSCLFSESSLLPRSILLTSSYVFDLYLFRRLVKWSRRLCTVTTNFSQLFAISGYILPCGSFSLTSTFTFKYTRASHFAHHINGLFVIQRHDRPKERRKQKISLQVV